MDEFILLDKNTEENDDNVPELFFGTLTTWNTSEGASFIPDGADAATSKKYKVILNGRPLYESNRYAILKISGTYLVLGQVGDPPFRSWVNQLSASATLEDVIARINSLLVALQKTGVLNTPPT